MVIGADGGVQYYDLHEEYLHLVKLYLSVWSAWFGTFSRVNSRNEAKPVSDYWPMEASGGQPWPLRLALLALAP